MTAGRGNVKPPEQRARRERRATLQVLSLDDRPEYVPDLPRRVDGQDWSPETHRWWATIWDSPMATQWLPADLPQLERLAELVEQWFTVVAAPNYEPEVCEHGLRTKERVTAISQLARSIEAGQKNFGLTPSDRARLDWQVATADMAKRRAGGRKPSRQRASGGRDPRENLAG